MDAPFDDPRFLDVNGVRLALFERPGRDPPILFLHATGFHARCWSRVAALIPGRRALAIDMRGHGLSSKPDPPYEWSGFGEDVASVARRLDLRGACGIGHSMGGHSLALAAALAPEAFSKLLLVDPVILPPHSYAAAPRPPHYARKRRNRWTSPAEMFERFKDRPPFRDWDPAVLRDYCDYGLTAAPDGDGYVLACPPAIEGAIYEASALPGADLYGRIERIAIPVTVVRSARALGANAGIDMAASPTAPDLAARFQNGRDLPTPYSHFIPMEAPAFIADLAAARL